MMSLPEPVTWILLAVVYTAVGVLIGIRLQQRRHAQSLDYLKSEARTDALTATLNRRGFDEVMPSQIRESQQLRTALSLLFVDVDRFKEINDSHGHAAGDRVLVTLIETMREQLREADMIARLGGDEFAVILRGSTLEQATQVAERLRLATVRQTTTDEDFTISVGVAAVLPNESAIELLKRSDKAAYASKQAGRNCCHFHDGQTCRTVSSINAN